MELLITGAGSALEGVGRAADGRAVFVPGALPGERVAAQVTQEKERFLKARLTRVIEASPHRRESGCPYAEQCGGCQARHMSYEYSLELKRIKVSEALTRIGGFSSVEVAPCLGMPGPDGSAYAPDRSRNKAEYPIVAGRIGTMAAGSRRVVEVEDCLLQAQSSVAAMRAARGWLNDSRADFSGYLVTRVTGAGEVMAILSTDRAASGTDALIARLREAVPGLRSVFLCRLNQRPAHALDGRFTRVWGDAALRDAIGDMAFRLSPQSFFQVNARQAEALYDAALSAASLSGHETIYDAYCGAGTVTLWLARHAACAVGVEIVAPAIDDANANARLNALQDRVRFEVGDAAARLPELWAGAPLDVVTVDPPRKGVDIALINALKKAAPPRIVYISCDPATLSRDLKRLCDSSPYQIASARPFDMFPWTEHVETVVLMSSAR